MTESRAAGGNGSPETASIVVICQRPEAPAAKATSRGTSRWYAASFPGGTIERFDQN
jgi:hypothetical protein